MCPSCLKKMEFLLCSIATVQEYTYFSNDSYEAREEFDPTELEGTRMYRCPHCDTIVATGVFEAKALLQSPTSQS